MRPFRDARPRLIAAVAGALLACGCAAPGPMTDQDRAARNEKGQQAMEGMENAILKDNNPATPVRAKPAN